MADVFAARSLDAELALINDSPGLMWASGGRPRAVFIFALRRGKIVAIELVAEPERLRKLEVVLPKT